jgi:hypothetical protein
VNIAPEHAGPSGEASPSRFSALWFQVRSNGLKLRRALRGPSAARLATAPLDQSDVVAESLTLLYPSGEKAEFALQAGKVQNLRVAARALDGVVIPPGQIFSFWAHVPRPVRRNGFSPGREIREGCVIPSTGGGLCQLSNALYDVALTAGCGIVERHAHTRRVQGSQAAVGRDATVFWNYVDLRFRPEFTAQIEVKLTARELIVRLRRLGGARCGPATQAMNEVVAPEAESCETCGVTQCFRHPAIQSFAQAGFTAWLLDSWQPEFDRYVAAEKEAQDHLFLPLDSERWRIGPYRWPASGFVKVHSMPWFVARRSWESRRLATQGAARQRALLKFDEALARRFARDLPPEATHLVISQNLLPYLWRDGVLGGRTFDVLMTRFPIVALEAVLDRAATAHPESRTLADFRAPREIAADESAALEAASRWITPHSAIAELAGERAVKLEWHLPKADTPTCGEWIVFPASTLARKGANELRDAVRALELSVRLCGPVIEAPEFWRGVRTEMRGELSLGNAACVVLPAWVDHWPRRLLAAVASGVPVIATPACGLAGVQGVTTIPEGDCAALRNALADLRLHSKSALGVAIS